MESATPPWSSQTRPRQIYFIGACVALAFAVFFVLNKKTDTAQTAYAIFKVLGVYYVLSRSKLIKNPLTLIGILVPFGLGAFCGMFVDEPGFKFSAVLAAIFYASAFGAYFRYFRAKTDYAFTDYYRLLWVAAISMLHVYKQFHRLGSIYELLQMLEFISLCVMVFHYKLVVLMEQKTSVGYTPFSVIYDNSETSDKTVENKQEPVPPPDDNRPGKAGE